VLPDHPHFAQASGYSHSIEPLLLQLYLCCRNVEKGTSQQAVSNRTTARDSDTVHMQGCVVAGLDSGMVLVVRMQLSNN
jgi:hypothetical protein